MEETLFLKYQSLKRNIEAYDSVIVAFSGGIDSSLVAYVAGQVLGERALAVTSASASLKRADLALAKKLATDWGIRHKVIVTDELSKPNYRANPVDRCFHCKTSLYTFLEELAQSETVEVVLNGTNTDDLSDYRPGLRAAETHGVRHPYVEAAIDKAGVRGIARWLGLDDLAELPAAPCLSSRIETGIAIDADTLRAVYRCERLIAQALSPRTVRCRVRRDAVVVEVDAESLTALDGQQQALLSGHVAANFARAGVERPVKFEPYRMGSAFLRSAADV